MLLFLVLRELRGYLAVFLVFLVALMFTVVAPHTTALINTLFIIYLFLIFYHLRSGARWALGLAVVYCWLIFFTKANMGIPAVLVMVVFLAYLLLWPKDRGRRPVLLAVLAFIVLGAGLALALNVDMLGFTLGSWHLADAYNDAMTIPFRNSPVPRELLPLSLAIVAAFVLLFLLNWRAILRDRDFLLAYLFVAGYLYLVFKHSYVHAWGHPWYFFQSAPAVLGLLAFFAAPGLRRWAAGVLIFALACAFPAGAQQYSVAALGAKINRLANYGQMALSGPPYYTDNTNLQTQLLPQEIIDAIGGGSVDVMPWEVSTVYYNDLDYNPRPVVQTYTTYDGWLDQRNEEKLLSENGPEYILFAMEEIDGRHPAFSDARTRRALLTHYKVALETPALLLLQRRADPLAMSVTPGPTGTVRLGDFIELPASQEMQFFSADIQYSLAGKLARFLYQPPMLWVTVVFEDGERRTFRAIKPLVNDQVLVDPFLETLPQARDYLESQGKNGRRVQWVRFDVGAPWAFQPEFDYQLTGYAVQEPGTP